ncbi:elongator complex protein 4 isoform X2 [Latimeria chalumnae]|uniref:elongator complex protein 4 isoform X2 n=1 Tax=Latimeria chalumnae TaxID=7897 RepID=UPI00313E4369
MRLFFSNWLFASISQSSLTSTEKSKMAASCCTNMSAVLPSGNVGISSTSFHKKSRSKLASIPGTRPSVQNGQLLVSTGVPSLDYVIGGGLAVGTLLLIEEDQYDGYSHVLFKYFLAEGAVCGHSIFVASAREHPGDILQNLPAPLLDDVVNAETEEEIVNINQSVREHQDSMKIAWRYQNLPKMQTSLASSSRFGHYFDVSKSMSPEMLYSVSCHNFYPGNEVSLDSVPMIGNKNTVYMKLLQSIQRVIRNEGFDGACPQKKQKNILRIGIRSLGSALWGDDICYQDNPEHVHSLTMFLYALRGLLRTSLTVCIITVPAHLIQNKAIMSRIVKLSDTVVGLESFNCSEKRTNPLYKDYHGLLHVYQIPRLNSLMCDVSEAKDLAFKLKRKLFTIEFHHSEHTAPRQLSDQVGPVWNKK